MSYQIQGKVLQMRYQIVQNLGAGVFGQTYMAVDIEHPVKSKCVVKQLKISSCHSTYMDYLRVRFLTETETLKHLGRHHQIPQLIACFEENEQFYLVQEFIEGDNLTTKLPINRQQGRLWSEREVVEFLKDVLGILEFVHSQGFIHCNVKPENLIRRTVDRKLFLIDFGSIQPIDFNCDIESSINEISTNSLGYIAPEQFIGQTQPNSDIYALGMIAIQALTGIPPLQLKLNPHSHEIIWCTENTPVNDYLAAILSKMTRYNFSDRFQSAGELLQVLKQMAWETQKNPVSSKGEPSALDKSSSLLTGVKVGLTVNTILMSLGTYSLISNSQIYSEKETLYQAGEEYQGGDLPQAIALANSISAQSSIYTEAQANIQEWKQQWELAVEQYLIAETAFDDGRWGDVFSATSKIPPIAYWRSKADKLAQQAQVNIQAETENLLAKAYTKAENRDFSAALHYLRQIPPESPAGAIVQKKLAEYNQKQQVRAGYFLHKAYAKALSGDFHNAIKILRQIPKNTPVYAQAQIKLKEYAQKQHQREYAKNLAILMDNSQPKIDPLIRSQSTNFQEDLQPGNYLQEVNIR